MNARKRKMLSFTGLAAVVIMLLTVQSAFAEVYTYKFGATVEHAPNWAPCGIGTGSLLTGTITFDDEQLDVTPKSCNDIGTCVQRFTGARFVLKLSDQDGCTYDNASFDNGLYAESIVATQPGDKIDTFRLVNVRDVGPLRDDWWLWDLDEIGTISLLTFYMELQYYGASYLEDFLIPDGLSQLALSTDGANRLTIGITALYDVGGYVSASITELRLVTPPVLILNLINTTAEINAKSGILNSLDAKLESAVKAMDDANESNDASAVYRLQAFMNAVEAQRGNQISEVEADSLVAAAQEIIDMLSLQ